jgi:UDP-N-acetylmuramyl pentapeptide synthase
LFEIEESWSSINIHLKNIYHIIKDLLFKKNRPKIYVLEYWIDYADEMKKLTKIVCPDFSLFTWIWTVHFGDRNKTLEAKRPLAKHTKKAVITNIDEIYHEKIDNLNCDYFDIWETGKIVIKNATIEENHWKWLQKSEIITWDEMYQISTNSLDKHIHLWIWAWIVFAQIISHQYHYSINTHRSLYIDIKQAPWRFNMISWVNDSIIIDSSYNSSPLSFIQAFEQFISIKNEFFQDYEARVFIWDMRELYWHEMQAHKDLCPLMIDAWVKKYFLIWEVMTNVVTNWLKGRGVKDCDIYCSSKSYILWNTIKEEIFAAENKVIIFVKGSQNTIFLEEWIKEFVIYESMSDLLCRQSESRITKKKEAWYIKI